MTTPYTAPHKGPCTPNCVYLRCPRIANANGAAHAFANALTLSGADFYVSVVIPKTLNVEPYCRYEVYYKNNNPNLPYHKDGKAAKTEFKKITQASPTNCTVNSNCVSEFLDSYMVEYVLNCPGCPKPDFEKTMTHPSFGVLRHCKGLNAEIETVCLKAAQVIFIFLLLYMVWYNNRIF